MLGLFNKSKSFTDLSSADFEAEMKRGNSVILDVRSRGEFASGHIQGAKNIDVQSPDFDAHVQKLDSSKSYLVYCRSGMRSASACSRLSKQGFENVSNLKGGIMAWRGKVVR